MTSITGLWQGGHIVLDGVAYWPDGCRVPIEPLLLAVRSCCGSGVWTRLRCSFFPFGELAADAWEPV